MNESRQERSPRWTTPAGYALGIAAAFGGAAAALFVSGAAGSLAALAAWSGIAMALLAPIASFRTKRHTWLLAAPAGFGFMFALTLALAEDWETQIQVGFAIANVALAVGAVVLIVAVARLTLRSNAILRDIAREAGEEMQRAGFFHEDGERIVVYPKRGRLLYYTLAQFAITALIPGGYLWALTNGYVDASNQIIIGLCVGLLVFLFGLIATLNLVRLAMRGPSLVVSADGILDNCSLIVTGRGLLRWSEILGVEEVNWRNGRMTLHYLDINLVDVRGLNERQSLLKRLLALFLFWQPIGVRLTEYLLDRPVSELAREIDHYIERHAPPGWQEFGTDEEEPEPSPEA